MGYIKKGIRDLSKEAGGKARAKSAAEDWFTDSRKAVREDAVQNTSRRFRPGQIYVFRYEDPKHAEWWDKNPTVLALDPASGNDCGINLNMLPPNIKEELLDVVYERFQSYIKGQDGKPAKNQGPLGLSYDGAKGFLGKFGFDFAIRQYIPSRKTQQAVVGYEHWSRIALCDFTDIEGKGVGAVRAMFRKHQNK
tara:strand:- start:1095 stop:1676 length:582 start_codon:yes stop_codon:yes gene_type:complete